MLEESALAGKMFHIVTKIAQSICLQANLFSGDVALFNFVQGLGLVPCITIFTFAFDYVQLNKLKMVSKRFHVTSSS